MLIADRSRNRIRKVNLASGIITTVAGNGFPGFSGDGQAATAAFLAGPGDVDGRDHDDRRQRPARRFRRWWSGYGAQFMNITSVASDARDNVYVLDRNAHRVRKIAGNGIITTIAGTGTRGFSGDGGPGFAAQLAAPVGLGVDTAGNVFIADTGNNRIRRVDVATGLISTVAGNGVQNTTGDGGRAVDATLFNPRGVAVDGAGNLFIAENRIRRVDGRTGIITGFAGTGSTTFSGDGGPATAAGFSSPNDITVGPTGDVFIADLQANRIRAVLACVTVAAPQLAAFADGSQLTSAPTLSWSAVPGAFRYDVYLDTVNPPVNVVASDLVALSYAVSNLAGGSRFYWKVVAKGDPFCPSPSSAGSQVRSFTATRSCVAPDSFTLVAPADGAAGMTTTTSTSARRTHRL